MEWPPRSGKHESFPEMGRAVWVTVEAAEALLVKSQVPILDAVRKFLL